MHSRRVLAGRDPARGFRLEPIEFNVQRREPAEVVDAERGELGAGRRELGLFRRELFGSRTVEA